MYNTNKEDYTERKKISNKDRKLISKIKCEVSNEFSVYVTGTKSTKIYLTKNTLKKGVILLGTKNEQMSKLVYGDSINVIAYFKNKCVEGRGKIGNYTGRVNRMTRLIRDVGLTDLIENGDDCYIEAMAGLFEGDLYIKFIGEQK